MKCKEPVVPWPYSHFDELLACLVLPLLVVKLLRLVVPHVHLPVRIGLAAFILMMPFCDHNMCNSEWLIFMLLYG